MVSRRHLAAIAIVLAIGACANHVPNTAVPASAVEGTFGLINEATPLAKIIAQQDIKPLDPQSPVPLLRQLQAQLAKTDADRRFAGVTYNLTSGNAVAGNWIVQTPLRWDRSAADLPVMPLKCDNCLPDFGLPTCRSDADCGGGQCRPLAAAALPGKPHPRVCLGHSDALVDRIYNLIVQAQQAVDITALQPPPDARFMAALRNAVTALARSGRRVTVRLLVGQYPLESGTDAKAVLESLIRDAKDVPNSRLAVYAGAIRSCTGEGKCAGFTWNHSKIVAVDGRAALVGGHNMWSLDYLIGRPVHDLSMQVRGPAAADASRFADAMWRFVCARLGTDSAVQAFSYFAGSAALGGDCRPQQILPPVAAVGTVPIMAVGRLGAGITPDFANQGDLARDLMLGAARQRILIAQQDIGFTLGRPDTLYPESTLERLSDFLLKHNGEVFIVLSNPGSLTFGGSTYSNGVPVEAVVRKIRQVARARTDMADAALDALLCRRLHVAPLRFGPDATWADGTPIANHSKFWMIDDRAFYIGSDNLYPVNLQEFGYIVDDRAAAAQLRRDYWDPMWRWSRLAAISGEGAPNCVLNTPAKAATK